MPTIQVIHKTVLIVSLLFLTSLTLLFLNRGEWLLGTMGTTDDVSESTPYVGLMPPATLNNQSSIGIVLPEHKKHFGRTLVPDVASINKAPIASPAPMANKKPVVQKTLVQHDNVWQNIIRNFRLDHRAQSARVQAEIRKLLAEKGKFNKILQAATPYINYIYLQTKHSGLPSEIALLPFIESEFNPNDYSNTGALGLWQFMPATARLLHIPIKGNYDGRRNLITSTHGAMLYFKDLGKYFKGNWLLAIAAYNCGQGRISQATRRAGSTNFWNLAVPLETKYYVPRLLAVAEIISHPNKYHIQLPKVTSTSFFTTLKVKTSLSLSTFAKKNGYSFQTLSQLNPDYKKTIIPKGTTLLVPNF